MPYTPPATTADSSTRNHHRSRSFSQEKGPGAFAPLAHIPRRAKAPPTFHLKGSSSESDDDDEELNATTTKADSIPFPTLASPSHTASFPSLNLPRAASTPQLTPSEPTPSIYRSPYTSGKSSPTLARKPLKPSLKSNHSSPHLPSLAGGPHTRILTQSAPTTPHLHPNSGTNSGASTPGSTYDEDGPYSACPSLPQTPKQVHFAAEKSSLESVVVFNKSARPRSLSTGNDTETETEGYDSSSNAWGANRYPFPVMSKQEDQPPQVVLDDNLNNSIPASSSVGYGGFAPGSTTDKRFVYLETLMLPGSKPPNLKGSILVRNIAFQKRVAVRFTMDDWQTVSEVSCNYAASLPSLPPPFAATGSTTPAQLSLDGGESYANGPLGYHNRAASLNSIMSAVPPTGRVDSWDRFTFTIKLEDVERTLVSKKLALVVRYTVPSQWGWECGGEWWDNNDFKNYSISFKYDKKTPTNTATAKESATMRTARSKQQDDIRRQTASLPPLPPPGPIRSLNLPGLHSLRAKVDKEGLLPPPVLRQGRVATFKESSKLETESPPPGSPTQRVFPKGMATNSPTVSPVNSAVWGSGGLLGTLTTSMYQAPPQPEQAVQEAKPPSLTISTSVNVSPPLSTGKAKRLSLSNYASPVSKPPSEHPSRTPSLTLSPDGSTPSPVTPTTDTLGLKVIGGMPATMVFNAKIEMDGSNTLPRRSFPASGRIGSWDSIWGAAGKIGAKKVFEHKPDANDVAAAEPQLPITDPLPTPPDSSSSATSTPELERSPEMTPRIDLPPPTEEKFVVDGPSQPGKDTIPFPAAENAIEPVERPMSNLARRTSMGNIKLEMPKRQPFDGQHLEEEEPRQKGPSPPPTDGAMPLSSPRGSDSGASSTATETPVAQTTTGFLSPSNSSSSISSLSKSDDSTSMSGPPAEFLAKYCFFVSSPSTSPPVPQVPRSGIHSPRRQPGFSSPSGVPNVFGAGIDTPRASSPGLTSVPPTWWSGTFSPPALSAGDGDRSRA